MKSYGRAPTFLLATGYEQVRSIAAALAGDWAAARDVQLDLPETGVCSSPWAPRPCSTTPPPAMASPRRSRPAHLRSLAAPAGRRYVADATRAAAAELGIDPDVALQLAALAGDQFDPQPTPRAAPAELALSASPARRRLLRMTHRPHRPRRHRRRRGPVHRRGRGIVAALAITQTVGYGTLYYAFAVLLTPSPPTCTPPPPRSPAR